MFILQYMVITVLFSLYSCENIHIGAVLSSKDNQYLLNDYVEKASARKTSKAIDLTFNASSLLMDSNPVRSALSICDNLITKRVHVIIASHPPSSGQSPISVSYTCGYYGIPLIGIYARDSAFSDKNVHPTFMRTVPPYFHQAYVWIDLLVHYDWKQVIFIHSMDEEGRSILSKFQALAEEQEIKIEKSVKFSVGSTNFTDLLKELPQQQSRVILLSAGKEDAENIYRDASELDLTTETDFVWLVTEEALLAINVPVGVIGLQLINGSNEAAHLEDSVSLIADTVTELFLGGNLTLTETPRNCSRQVAAEDERWEQGVNLLESIKRQNIDGQTGRLSFNEEGDRLNPMYWIKNVHPAGTVVVGYHGNRQGTEEKKLSFGNTPIEWPSGDTKKPKGIKISTHLRVITIEAKPFVYQEPIVNGDMRKCNQEEGILCKHYNTTTQIETEHCCYGYCMKMLQMLAAKVNFTYDLYLSSNDSFGSFKRVNNGTKKEWTGMVGELVNEQADLVVAPLTINPERAQAIDFSKPFKYQGLTILVKKEQKDSSLASFLQPFQDTLWILVGLSVHVIALVLYLLDRFSPFGRFKLAKNDDTEEDALNLSSAMWFAWGVLLNSGIGEGTPRSFSARVLGMVWAGFAMIIVASYTANLAAFLVLDRPDASISGIDDSRLRNPNENFRYATVKDSAVEMYFKRQVELSTMYRKMEEYNYNNADDAINDVKEGIKLQAFIWDSSRLEYEDARHCDLVVAGELFGRSGLGVGLRKGSPWTHPISLAILELHEGGDMEKLDNKWILIESTDCPERDHTPATLGLTNMAGVFMMVAGGIVAGVFLIFVEILYKRHRGLKEKELELARNAADRWRGNIAKKKHLRESWAFLRAIKEEQQKKEPQTV
ncbi:glutamate [NMDA] receptor subunit 1-like isoform X2 [Ruditapes philippinarum]|uniref:glutamate [NMDA] receptor subunit 1-like isoform X2 n=1 Tax=Ruditapes philippinarum TaxID=129788 RepID=UPI00295B594B|nr:glutamate [NMDA] receptor subunit 1-like isoform X2 [Ruditapes philippinarum]